MAMRTTASSKGICILRFSMLSIHVVVYRLYPTCVHLTSSNTAGKKKKIVLMTIFVVMQLL